MIIVYTENNAAFESNWQEHRDILARIAIQLEQGAMRGAVRDTNGNTIGRWSRAVPEVKS